MDDRQLVELFWRRDETALEETERKYGGFCFGVAMRLLGEERDARETVNEALYQAWDRIPPERPEKLGAWLGRVTRNLSVSLWRKNHRQKRYGGIAEALDELEESIPSPESVERELESAELGQLISRWLKTLPREDRVLFVRRYWYGVPLQDLAKETATAPGKLAQKMYRLRADLKTALEKGGHTL